MTRLNPYLRFNDGKCKEAMNFYKAIFGGTVEMMTIGESPMAQEMPAEKRNMPSPAKARYAAPRVPRERGRRRTDSSLRARRVFRGGTPRADRRI